MIQIDCDSIASSTIYELYIISPILSITKVTSTDQTIAMSTITRTIRNLRKIGFKEAAHQMQHIGDTKAGRLVGIDKMGNKYFENNVL